MVRVGIAICIAVWGAFQSAGKELDRSMPSKMRGLYAQVIERSNKVREGLSGRIADARRQNDGEDRWEEFRTAERTVRVLETLPQPKVSEAGPTRMWNLRRRFDGYEPRAGVENYLSGPESEVILFNRELTQEVVDLSLPGRGEFSFVFRRTYYSNLSYDGPLGCGWDHSYNARLLFSSEDTAILHLNGRTKMFVRKGECWESEPGNFYQLRSEGALYCVYNSTLARMEFERSVENNCGWRLKAIATRHDNYTANRIELSYADGLDRLVRIKDPLSQNIVLSYDPNGRIAQICTGGDSMNYEYDKMGNLIAVSGLPVLRTMTEAFIPRTAYAYLSKGGHCLMVTRKFDGEKREYDVEYDGDGKVTCVGFRAMDGLDARWRFAEKDGSVEVRGPAPRALVRYDYDCSATARDLPLRHVIPSVGATNEFTYSQAGLLLSVRDAIGCIRQYKYDADSPCPCSRKNMLLETTIPRSIDGKVPSAKIAHMTRYGACTSFPTEDCVVETDMEGGQKELCRSQFVYSKDWEILESNENGLKSRRYYNRYGNLAISINALDTADIYYYGDECPGRDSKYEFVSGKVTGGGRLCALVEDAKDDQIAQAIKALGEHAFYRTALRVKPVARETLYCYDRYGNRTGTKRNGRMELKLCNREGDVLASYAPRQGVKIESYTASGVKTTDRQEVGANVVGFANGETNRYFHGRYAVEDFQRDSLGRVTACVQNATSLGVPAAHFQYRRYDGGAVKEIVNPAGVSRIDKYDLSSGLLTAQTLVNGGLSQVLTAGLLYDARGELLESEDALGEKTSYGYDEFGRRVVSCTPDGVVHRTRLDGLGRIVAECADVDGRRISHTDFHYGAYGKISDSVVDRIDATEKERIVGSMFAYDDAGQKFAEQGMRKGEWTYYLIDGLGRTVATMLPDGEFRFVAYDGDDLFLSATCPCSKGVLDKEGVLNGNVAIHDGAGNAICSLPLNGDWELATEREVDSAFDCQGQLVSVETRGQAVKLFSRDVFGRIVAETTRPQSRRFGERECSIRYEYRPDGQLKRKIVDNDALVIRDVDGSIAPSRIKADQVLEYGYDPLGRSVEICQPDGLVVRRKYDKRSMPVEMTWSHLAAPTNVLRKLELKYGVLGRLFEIRDGAAGGCLQKYEYDVYGNWTKSVDCGGGDPVTVERRYDSLGTMVWEETAIGDYKFPVCYEVDLVRGKVALDLNKLFGQSWVRDVSESNWRRQEATMDALGRVTELRLARRRESFPRRPFASWKYRGDQLVERDVPSSHLKTVSSYDGNGLLVNSKIRHQMQTFGVLGYSYDELANLISESTFLYQDAAHQFEAAQYYDYSAYRQLVAQNVESMVLPENEVIRRRQEVLEGLNGSLQATKTFRMVYDQTENLWAEYSGVRMEDAEPEKFTYKNLLKMLSPGSVVNGGLGLSDLEMRELASNREVTRAAFSDDVLKAEMNEYDRLGCLKHFDGEYWNGVREYPVRWDLEYDALGRLSRMQGTLRNSVCGMERGRVAAKLQFAYDSNNRRVRKEVEDNTRSMFASYIEWTIYDGNNQMLVLRQDHSQLTLREQYLWHGDSRELVMASLSESEAENIASALSSRYYFQQDRGLNTVCVTRADGGLVSLVSGASYLGFGKNSTASRIVGVSSSLGKGERSEASYNAQLDDGHVAEWSDAEGVQYIELKLSEVANLTELAIWPGMSFPKSFSIFVLPPDAGSIVHSADAAAWSCQQENLRYLIAQRDLQGVERERPVRIPLYGIRGDRLLLVWQGESCRSIEVREFEVQRKPNNPGSIAYAGQWLDRETGLYYQINRYKLAGSNKFISPDPIGFMDGNNLYAYAKNNPLEWHDPNGEWAHIVLGAVAGAALNGGVYALQCWITGEDFSWKECAIQVGIGAIAGGIAAATFGAVNPFLAQHGFNAAANIVISSAASGLTSGFASGTAGSLMHGSSVSDALTAGAKDGCWGMLGGAIGGGVVSKFGASLGSTVLSGAAAGGTVSGLRNSFETYMDTGDWTASLEAGLIGAGRGVVAGAAISAAGWGVGRATGMIKPLKGYPDHLPDPRQKGVMVKTSYYKDTKQIPKYLKPFKSLLSYRDTGYDGVQGEPGEAIHHIKPVSLGGTTTRGNLVPIPVEQHFGPGNMHPGSYVNKQPVGTIFY